MTLGLAHPSEMWYTIRRYIKPFRLSFGGIAMSGHNKWSTIKHKKEKTDAQKGKVFTKIGREIIIAIKEGGGADPNTNSKLKDVIAKAKAANMPNDNIQRSIKKASGEGDSANYKEMLYEGYGPGGVAVLVECVTDNLNRTASEVRHIFDKCGGSLGATGCVGWMFERKGLIELDNSKNLDEDELMMVALDAGASDVEVEDGACLIYTDPNDFSAVRDNLEKAGFSFLSAERAMIPTNTVKVEDPEAVAKVEKLIDMLEDNDDAQNIFHNAELPEEDEEE